MGGLYHRIPGQAEIRSISKIPGISKNSGDLCRALRSTIINADAGARRRGAAGTAFGPERALRSRAEGGFPLPPVRKAMEAAEPFPPRSQADAVRRNLRRKPQGASHQRAAWGVAFRGGHALRFRRGRAETQAGPARCFTIPTETFSHGPHGGLMALFPALPEAIREVGTGTSAKDAYRNFLPQKYATEK